ncbi:MAG: RecX family transcriptional regulator [Chloroflexi bacterium]|nr:RecX family transcriptional regulator [Chloroflexota bacterium]
MQTIISIKALRGTRGQAQVRLDDGQSLWLGCDLLAEERLSVGQTLSPEQAEALLAADQVRRGLSIAYRLLGYRPRSRAEIEVRLRRAALGDTTIRQVLQRLEKEGLLDDAAFAQFWRRQREQANPRGRKALLFELGRLGVDPDTARTAVADVDEVTSACQAGRRFARHLPADDPGEFKRRLTAGLRRRGFGTGATHSAVEQLLAEGKVGQP